MTAINFDASQVEPSAAPDPVPSGWYRGYMHKSELVATKDQTGSFIEAWYTITDPPEFANRKVVDRMNMANRNQVAVDIGYRTLSAVCHSIGVLQVVDTQQLHNQPLEFKVSLRPAGYGNNGQYYEASNEVKGYRAVTTGPIGPASTLSVPGPNAPPQQPWQAAPGAQPWQAAPGAQPWQAAQPPAGGRPVQQTPPQGAPQYAPPPQAPATAAQPPVSQAPPMAQPPQTQYAQPAASTPPFQGAPQTQFAQPAASTPPPQTAQPAAYAQQPQAGQQQPTAPPWEAQQVPPSQPENAPWQR